ncbi:MAG TPA: hypothetical protein VF554_07490 [Thermoanaerobaculia bacterium]|jgi:hypothetical protein
MCHQTVGLIAGELERRGIATTTVTMLREITQKVRTPRALAVPYALGFPLGKPGDPELQTRILRAAFALLEEPGPGPLLVDFSEAWSRNAP